MYPSICLVQFHVEPAHPLANRKKVAELLAQNPPPVGSLVILPELYSTGFLTKPEDLEDISASDVYKEDVQFLSDLAKKNNWNIAGASLSYANGKFLNLAIAFDTKGILISTYQKIHLFSLAAEDKSYASGTKVSAFPWNIHVVEQEHSFFAASPSLTQSDPQTSASQKAPIHHVSNHHTSVDHILNVQQTICYDIRFPELYRAGLDHGAQVMLVQAHWPASRQLHWDTLLPARAIENQAMVAGVNVVGKVGHLEYAGGSAIYSPRGECLLKLGNEEVAAHTPFHMHEALEWRDKFPVLKDRKGDTFWSNLK